MKLRIKSNKSPGGEKEMKYTLAFHAEGKKQRNIQSYTCMIRSAIEGQNVKTALGSPFELQ